MWRQSGLSQRRLAEVLDVPFNSMHGKIFRYQERLASRGKEAQLLNGNAPHVFMRAAVFDIEVTDFNSGGLDNFLVCTSVLPLDTQETKTVALEFDDKNDDRRILAELMEELEQYDILIGHNIAAFDFNWLFSRLIYHGMPNPPKRWLYYDTYQAAKRIAIKSRKSLGMLGDFFQLDGEKTSVLPVTWSKVHSRRQEVFEQAMEDIVYHCEQDVLLNRNLFNVLYHRDRAVSMPYTKKW